MKTTVGSVGSGFRITVPREVRAALGLGADDMLAWQVHNGRVTVTRALAVDRAYLKAVESTLSEWLSPEDGAAYDKL